ncbi:MAG: DUF2061 domain-containing protein [Parvibaculaceae bacterium]|nr:DUF2061 domain-containing protein [Parvibaculaceae bacterium]
MRDLLKTLSFAVLHFCVGFVVAYCLTGSLGVALGVALIEPSINTVVFYFHELAWKKDKIFSFKELFSVGELAHAP